MDHESFEKMDKDFLSSLKNVRERKVPEAVRRNFKRSVEERLASSVRPGGFSLSFLILPALAVVFGAVLCWIYLKPVPSGREMIPAEAEAQKNEIAPQMAGAPLPAPGFKAPALSAGAQKAIHSNVQIDDQPSAKQPELSQITESNIVSEVELLKELGVWTEKDEEEVGITSDQIFEELETLAGELLSGAAGGNVPQASAQ